MTLGASLALLAALAAPAEARPSATPTFCVEWIRQSRAGYERVTLFRDRTAIWKSVSKGEQNVRRKTITPEELEFYCSYFARAEFREIPDDLRTGLTGDFASQSTVTLAGPDGIFKRFRFDELSALTAHSAALRSALEGLKSIFTNPLAPASRFTADQLPRGTILKRFDGAVFRVVRIDAEQGFVEIAGINEPYSQFVKLEELRFQFSPPE